VSISVEAIEMDVTQIVYSIAVIVAYILGFRRGVRNEKLERAKDAMRMQQAAVRRKRPSGLGSK
jgi:hypothetical protein